MTSTSLDEKGKAGKEKITFYNHLDNREQAEPDGFVLRHSWNVLFTYILDINLHVSSIGSRAIFENTSQHR